MVMKREMILLIFVGLFFFFENAYSQPTAPFPDQSQGIKIFPNPVQSGHFVIENDSSGYDHTDRLLIFNSNGVLLSNRPLPMNRGVSRQIINIASFAPGNYFIRIVDTIDPYFSFASQLLVN